MQIIQASRVYDGSRPFDEHLRLHSHDTPVTEAWLRNSFSRCVRIKSPTRKDGELVGTGMIIQTGYVITNYHLLGQRSEDKVYVNDNEAEVIHFDLRLDLAILKVSRGIRIGRVQFSHKVTPSTSVYYVGNPEEMNKSVMQGYITKVTDQRIITDIHPGAGMSGSGMYDKATGKCVAVVDHMLGSSEKACNFTIAVPAPLVEQVFSDALYKDRFGKR